MSDIAGQESTSTEYTEAPAPEAAPIETQDHSTEQQETNPFWGEIEKLTGPNVFRTIKPHLDKADSEARNRISAVNQSYAPWKAFADRGIQPAHVEQALGVVQQLNTSPEQVFTSLQEFLRREGRLPSTQELKEEVVEDLSEDEEDPRDAQIKALQDQQAQIAQFLQNQQLSAQRQIAAQEADSWLQSETQKLSANYTEADIKEIVRIAAFQAQQTGQDPESLDSAAAQFNALRERILTAPRPGQLAPRLPSGPGGGGSPAQQAIDPSQLTKQQRLELVQATLARGRQS